MWQNHSWGTSTGSWVSCKYRHLLHTGLEHCTHNPTSRRFRSHNNLSFSDNSAPGWLRTVWEHWVWEPDFRIMESWWILLCCVRLLQSRVCFFLQTWPHSWEWWLHCVLCFERLSLWFCSELDWLNWDKTFAPVFLCFLKVDFCKLELSWGLVIRFTCIFFILGTLSVSWQAVLRFLLSFVCSLQCSWLLSSTWSCTRFLGRSGGKGRFGFFVDRGTENIFLNFNS